jgi:hypothetical protein
MNAGIDNPSVPSVEDGFVSRKSRDVDHISHETALKIFHGMRPSFIKGTRHWDLRIDLVAAGRAYRTRTSDARVGPLSPLTQGL